MGAKRKKILHVVWSFNNGGIETMLVNIANHQSIDDEVAVMIVNASYDNSLLSTLSEKVRLFCVDRPLASKNPYYYAKLNFIYRRFAPDIVHFHQLSLTKIFVKRKSDKWFFTQHCIPESFIPNKNINTYIAISECVKEGIIRLAPVENCVVCYNGVDFTRIADKSIWNDGSQRIRIIAAARLDTKIKSQDTVIEAVRLLPKEIQNRCVVDIYGDGPDKYMLEKMVKDHDLDGVVNICGNISNKKLLQILKDYDLSIHASRIEGFGLSAVEAMGCGVPVILSDVLGHKEISPERISFIPSDATDLARKIEYCINHYEEIKEIADRNKDFVKNRFTIQNMVGNLNEIYDRA